MPEKKQYFFKKITIFSGFLFVPKMIQIWVIFGVPKYPKKVKCFPPKTHESHYKAFVKNMERTWVPKEAKSDSGGWRSRNASRSSKSITLRKGLGQLFELGNDCFI